MNENPHLKKLRAAVILAIDSCDEPDDEAVWLELNGFIPEWQHNLARSRAAKIPHAFVPQKNPCKACESCGEVEGHRVHVAAQENALERANVFHLFTTERITDAQATQALNLIESREP